MANIDQPCWNGLGVTLFFLSAITILMKTLAGCTAANPGFNESSNEVIQIMIERVWSKTWAPLASR
jgi:hypothetical protein